jgi:hypothetical protein
MRHTRVALINPRHHIVSEIDSAVKEKNFLPSTATGVLSAGTVLSTSDLLNVLLLERK